MSIQTTARPQAVAEIVEPASKENVVLWTPPPGSTSFPPKLAKAIMAIKRKIDPVAKSGEVKFGNVHYFYPKSDDVLDAVIPLVTEHGLIITQSEIKQVLFENEKTLAITYIYTIVNEDGDVWPDRIERTGLAWVRDSRGNVDDKAANKCSTQSEKYFYIKFFGIRTSDAAQLDNDAQVPGQEQADTTPKPPKPGSAEAKAMEGPRALDSVGHNADSWANVFIAAIETATPVETEQWIAANKNSLDRLGNYPEIDGKVKKAIDARKGVTTERAAPKPPRPPKPAAVTMPDPATDAAGWIKWLTDKFASFETYEAGESYWNGTIEALDLPVTLQEDAMGVWQRFSERHEP